MPRFGRREAAREVEKVEKGARTLKRRLLDDDEKNAPSVATTRGQHVARKLVIGAAFVYLAHRAWPRVRQDGGRAIRALKRSLGGLNPLQGRRGRGRKGRRRRGNDADAPHPSVDGATTRTSRETAVEKISRAARARSPEASPSGVHRTLPAAVSDSSKSIAALRSLEEDARRPLFDDPFAAALAGPDAVARVRARNGDKGRIAIRTRFFDDAVLDALEGGGTSSSTSHRRLAGGAPRRGAGHARVETRTEASIRRTRRERTIDAAPSSRWTSRRCRRTSHGSWRASSVTTSRSPSRVRTSRFTRTWRVRAGRGSWRTRATTRIDPLYGSWKVCSTTSRRTSWIACCVSAVRAARVARGSWRPR